MQLDIANKYRKLWKNVLQKILENKFAIKNKLQKCENKSWFLEKILGNPNINEIVIIKKNIASYKFNLLYLETQGCQRKTTMSVGLKNHTTL